MSTCHFIPIPESRFSFLFTQKQAGRMRVLCVYLSVLFSAGCTFGNADKNKRAYQSDSITTILQHPQPGEELSISKVVPILASQAKLDCGIEGVSGNPKPLNRYVKWFQENVQDAQLATYCRSGNTILSLYAFDILSIRNVKLAMAVLDSNIANTKEYEYICGCICGYEYFNIHCYNSLKRDMSEADKKKYSALISKFYTKEQWTNRTRSF
jgi:hypothetical protein